MESVLNNNGSALYLHTFHARPDCSSVNGEKLQSQTQCEHRCVRAGAHFTNWTQDGSHITGEHFICSDLHYIIMKEMVKKIKVYPSMWDMSRNVYLLLVLGEIIKKHWIYGLNSLNKQFYPNIQKVNFDYLFSYFLIHTLET